jgi:predicted RNA-binding Zn-ribbon protein involved in translation (DUF1610 family)
MGPRMNPNNSSDSASMQAAQAENLTTVCPKCGEKSLHLVEERGSDDYGDLEGAREFCEKCGYDTGWCVGRC